MNFRDIVMNNKGLKLTAFILAVSVWVFISGRERTYLEKNFIINIEHSNVSEMIDVQNRPDTVRIMVRGTAEEIDKISEKDFNISIDLNDVEERSKLTMFTEDHLTFPEGIEIISINPKIFEVTVREFYYKEVPIRVLYTGRLPRGVVLVERKLNPEKVKIFGYKSEIKNIDMIYGTDKINLSEINDSSVISISLEKREEILRFEGYESVQVSLKVKNINEKKK
ncbi:MAG: YbbR-like domain-containing protein [Candidatus Aminicenantes bacterium]|nr:YbbR-like domain-containing protein [Candidatus Aminicenantes bacterium]